MKNKKDLIPVILRKPLVYLLIVAVGSLVYFKSLFFGLTYLDDSALIIDNYRFLGQLSNIFEAFRHQVFHTLNITAAYYRPMLIVSLIIDAHLGGANPLIYHLTNIVIHLVVSCLVYKLLTKLGYTRQLALLFALIFSVHPVLSQAVSWIPGRNDSLLALFSITSFIFFLDFLETKKAVYCLAHIFFFGLALFTKESALALMPVCLLFHILIWKDGKGWKGSLKLIFPVLGWLAASGLWFFMRSIALGSNIMPMTGMGIIKSMLLNSPAIIQFIGKIVFPFNLSVLPLMQDTTFTYGIFALLLIAAALFFSKRAPRIKLVVFGLFWFIVFLLPSFMRPNPGIASDFIEHRVYMPLIGFFILLLEIGTIKSLDFKLKKDLVPAAMIVILFGAVTFFHIDNFKDRLSFWLNAAKASPHSPLAHRNLGAIYYLAGEPDKSEPEYRKALELNPTEPMAHNNLGLLYTSRGNFEEAQEEYKKELEINPSYDDAYFNLGVLYYKMGELEMAEKLWRRTIELNPDHAGANTNLSILQKMTSNKEAL